MNKTSKPCYRPSLNFLFLSQRQVGIPTMINSVVMIGNVSVQIFWSSVFWSRQNNSQITRLNFMLSVSDLTIELFGQNLKTTILYEKNCLIMDTYTFVTVILVHLSMYIIAILGVDRYVRIKQFVKFNFLWISRVTIAFISIEIFLSLLQAIMVLIGLVQSKNILLYLFTFRLMV